MANTTGRQFCRNFRTLSRRFADRSSGKNQLLSSANHVRSSLGDFMSISDEVAAALKNQVKPVVALESTIIAHGMPYPHNLETALMVEDVVRQNGAVPATVAFLKGKLCIGLNKSELEYLANSKSDVIKSSRRDLAYVVSQKLDGSTTVSGTMVAAHLAGIKVFVTGGVGGVHRGAESSMDISADLTELGRTPVAVVCAGVKSILDIGRTLEYLETQGVPVVTLGKSPEFPAFFTPTSGFKSPYKLSSAKEVASLIATHFTLGLSNGLLIAVPIPEQHALDAEEIETAIKNAINEANVLGISGKGLTPFLLNAVNKLTAGKSLKANIELIRNNAAVGSRIACHLNGLTTPPGNSPLRGSATESQGQGQSRKTSGSSSSSAKSDVMKQNLGKPEDTTSAKQVVVIGGINFDLTMSLGSGHTSLQANGMTHKGRMRRSFGGVGRNLADCLSRLGAPPLFISMVGDDWVGKLFREQFQHMDLRGVGSSKTTPTAVYSAILSASRELLCGIGDFEIHREINSQHIQRYEDDVRNAQLVCMDGNLSHESMDFITDMCHQSKVPVWFEPTDINQIEKLFKSAAWQKLTYISPNINELQVFAHFLETQEEQMINKLLTDFKKPETLSETLDFCLRLCRAIINHVPNIILTLGRHGVLLVKRNNSNGFGMEFWNDQFIEKNGSTVHQNGELNFLYHPAIWPGLPEPTIQSVSGAGDCLAAAIIAGMQAQLSGEASARLGILAARKSLSSYEAVPSSITPELIEENIIQESEERKGYI